MAQLKKQLIIKRDNKGMGILFSLTDDADKYLKLTGIALEIIEKMLKNEDFQEIKASILQEYDIQAEVLEQDLESLLARLKEANFLEQD
jgi:hypothetical protein